MTDGNWAGMNILIAALRIVDGPSFRRVTDNWISCPRFLDILLTCGVEFPWYETIADENILCVCVWVCVHVYVCVYECVCVWRERPLE